MIEIGYVVALVQWLRIAFCLPLAICAVHTAANAQLAPSTPRQPIEVRIIVDSRSSQWSVRITNREDTVVSAHLPPDTTRVLLRTAPSYFINISRSDTNLWANYYLNPAVVSCSSLVITCTDSGVSISDLRVRDYSRIVQSFVDTIPQILFQMRAEPLDVVLVRLDQTIDERCTHVSPLTAFNVAATSIDPAAHKALKQFVGNLRTRLQTSIEHPASGILLRHHQMSAEAYLIARTMALGIAQTMALDKRDKSRWARIRSLLGDYCPCEVAYSFITGSAVNPGVDFSSCDQPLPRIIDSLASQSNGYYCRETKRELSEACQTINGRVVREFEALNRYGTKVRRQLSPDSVYVLHFWGTWCEPCIREYDAAMSISDSLALYGVNVIHIANELPSGTRQWKQFIGDAPAEHLLVHPGRYSSNSIFRALHINSYPSFVVIGKGNREVLPRPLWASAVIDRARQLIQSDQR